MPSIFIFMTFMSLLATTCHAHSSVGAISSALGGGGRSSVDPGESFVMNPATITHFRGASLSFGTNAFHETTNWSDGSSDFEGWHLSLNENGDDSPFGTSIFIRQVQFQNPTAGKWNIANQKETWFTIGNFILPQLCVGINYHYLENRSLVKTYQEHNIGLGLMWTPLNYLGIGLSIQNLKSPPESLPMELAQGTNMGVGILYLKEEYLRFRLDYSQTTHPIATHAQSEWALGLENAMTPWLLARIGWAREVNGDRQVTQKLGLGLGFSGPRFGIHYGYQQLQISREGAEHGVDFSLPF